MSTAAVLLALSVAVAGPPPDERGAPSIQITGVPTYGVDGFLSGTTSGADPTLHEVAVVLHIEGAGWWSKPTAAAPTVPINVDGTWSADVATGGIDNRATIYCAALVPVGGVPTVGGGASLPAGLPSLALDCHERYSKTLSFAGRTWGVKESPSPVGPGGNPFSNDPNDVWVDAAGKLHLTARFHDGLWWATEVMLIESLGHGTYWFVTESELEDLDLGLTFGAFTWDPHGDDATIPAWPNREIDFEDGRWGSAGDPLTSQTVVQPYFVAGNLTRFALPDLAGAPTLSRWFTWMPTRIDFTAATGWQTPCNVPASALVHQNSYVHDPLASHLVPPAGRERFRFNLWLHGFAPPPAADVEIVVADFRFTPAERAFPLGCHVNPTDSLVVLSGTPSIGTTLTLGVDNPAGTQALGALPLVAVSAGADPAYPCGASLPGFGMAGALGELLIPLAPAPFLVVVGPPWAGAGTPSPIPLPIPADAGLVGFAFYAQGALLDASPGAIPAIGLAGGLELCIGP